MTKILSATVAIVAFAAPSIAQQDKTTGQAPRDSSSNTGRSANSFGGG